MVARDEGFVAFDDEGGIADLEFFIEFELGAEFVGGLFALAVWELDDEFLGAEFDEAVALEEGVIDGEDFGASGRARAFGEVPRAREEPHEYAAEEKCRDG